MVQERSDPSNPSPAWAESLVRFMDDGLVIPGTRMRIGFDGLIGLILPGAGDALTAASSVSLFWLAVQRGVPRVVLTRMAINVAIDAFVGAVPVLGDLFDFGWKANRKNLQLIERATSQPRARSASDYAIIALFGLLVLAAVSLPILLTALLIRAIFQ